MPYGSVLSKFKQVIISTADQKKYEIKMSLMNRFFLRIMGIPHLGFRHRARIIFNLINQLELKPDAKILDAGCGYGMYSFMLAEKQMHVECIDIEEGRIEQVKSRIHEYPLFGKYINPRVGSLTQLPFEDQTFDMILCSEVIEHINEDFKAVKELCRVLIPGGHLILTTPTNSRQNHKVYQSFGHVRPGYTDEAYYDFAKINNLKIEKMIHYEFAVGSYMFVFQQMMNKKILLGMTFYPLYVLSLMDLVLRIGEPNGVVGMFLRKKE